MESKKIMLIEDDFSTQFLLSECLRTEKYEVIPLDHGKSAIAYLRTHEMPDLILMDLTLPFLSAEDFVSQVRELPSGNETPIILVSGKSDVGDYAHKLQAQGFISKPFDLDPLLEMISKTIH